MLHRLKTIKFKVNRRTSQSRCTVSCHVCRSPQNLKRSRWITEFVVMCVSVAPAQRWHVKCNPFEHHRRPAKQPAPLKVAAKRHGHPVQCWSPAPFTANRIQAPSTMLKIDIAMPVTHTHSHTNIWNRFEWFNHNKNQTNTKIVVIICSENEKTFKIIEKIWNF